MYAITKPWKNHFCYPSLNQVIDFLFSSNSHSLKIHFDNSQAPIICLVKFILNILNILMFNFSHLVCIHVCLCVDYIMLKWKHYASVQQPSLNMHS